MACSTGSNGTVVVCWVSYIVLRNDDNIHTHELYGSSLLVPPPYSGPVVSQLLLSDFVIDTINVAPKQTTLKPGMDYMTTVKDWLDVQVCRVLPVCSCCSCH